MVLFMSSIDCQKFVFALLLHYYSLWLVKKNLAPLSCLILKLKPILTCLPAWFLTLSAGSYMYMYKFLFQVLIVHYITRVRINYFRIGLKKFH